MKAGSPGAKVGATPVGALMWFTGVAALRSVVKAVCVVNGWMNGGETATDPVSAVRKTMGGTGDVTLDRMVETGVTSCHSC
jgi:hypothetical protein